MAVNSRDTITTFHSTSAPLASCYSVCSAPVIVIMTETTISIITFRRPFNLISSHSINKPARLPLSICVYLFLQPVSLQLTRLSITAGCCLYNIIHQSLTNRPTSRWPTAPHSLRSLTCVARWRRVKWDQFVRSVGRSDGSSSSSNWWLGGSGQQAPLPHSIELEWIGCYKPAGPAAMTTKPASLRREPASKLFTDTTSWTLLDVYWLINGSIENAENHGDRGWKW